MAESKKRPEIKFEFIKTKRPPPKGVLQEIAREFEDEAKEKRRMKVNKLLAPHKRCKIKNEKKL